VGHTRPNAKPKVHTSINLLFANVPENLRVPRILASSSDFHVWNKRSSTNFEVLFASANAYLEAFLYLVRTLEGYSRSFSHPFRGLDL
jgi:hypothetical protein